MVLFVSLILTHRIVSCRIVPYRITSTISYHSSHHDRLSPTHHNNNKKIQQQHVYSWWQKEFLPKTLDAFSCGFNEKTDTVVADPRTLPGDIQDYFATDRTLQQAWRLVKGYIRSPQKQRERGFRVSRYMYCTV